MCEPNQGMMNLELFESPGLETCSFSSATTSRSATPEPLPSDLAGLNRINHKLDALQNSRRVSGTLITMTADTETGTETETDAGTSIGINTGTRTEAIRIPAETSIGTSIGSSIGSSIGPSMGTSIGTYTGTIRDYDDVSESLAMSPQPSKMIKPVSKSQSCETLNVHDYKSQNSKNQNYKSQTCKNQDNRTAHSYTNGTEFAIKNTRIPAIADSRQANDVIVDESYNVADIGKGVHIAERPGTDTKTRTKNRRTSKDLLIETSKTSPSSRDSTDDFFVDTLYDNGATSVLRAQNHRQHQHPGVVRSQPSAFSLFPPIASDQFSEGAFPLLPDFSASNDMLKDLDAISWPLMAPAAGTVAGQHLEDSHKHDIARTR